MKSLSALNALLVASLPHLVASVDPHVNLTYTQYLGQPTVTNVTQWLGMRYAAPPVRRLRFAHPYDAPNVDPRFTPEPALKHGPRCIPAKRYPIDESREDLWSEDCLFLNVFAPSNATPESKLPVFVYIQGLAFEVNSPADLNGGGLVTASNHSIIVVTFNYRVGPLGFLTGYDVLRREQAEGLRANAGFLDQQKALLWVQRHISKFGGDPNHVVLGGSGASLSWHLTANDGKDTGLFHAVAGSSPSWGHIPHHRDLQGEYLDFIRHMGCEFKSAEPESICLQLRKTWQEIRNHNFSAHTDESVHWGPVIDDKVFKRTPFEAFRQGLFVRVPVISGDSTDSGKLFTPLRLSNPGDSSDFLLSRFPFLDRADLGTISALYPYRYPDQASCRPYGCWWELASRVFGDISNQCPALYTSLVVEREDVESYNYRYNVEDADYIDMGLGVTYGMEAMALFGLQNVPQIEGALPWPRSYLPGEPNSKSTDVMQAYWISFIRTFNPNSFRYPGSAEWVRFRNESSKERLRLDYGGKTSMEGVGRDILDKCSFFYNKVYPASGRPLEGREE
ncbi:Alpha/Beta hydrolase protein [Cladorrhinum sp. PSN332]|nr:Alpha/Beta hydrolase protein [Cladorrhinum sp. PSN332]